MIMNNFGNKLFHHNKMFLKLIKKKKRKGKQA